ncbi:hypothetical protein PRUPE_6G016500 [Prunus persica]|uniref:Uncharacterized protein n=1 Tax=Prunus persica TaxID=3760 RepID=A0A251NKG5_PRUPE|nr:hypothetical protein PRUPE_6G016500 [Prunus persica]
MVIVRVSYSFFPFGSSSNLDPGSESLGIAVCVVLSLLLSKLWLLSKSGYSSGYCYHKLSLFTNHAIITELMV